MKILFDDNSFLEIVPDEDRLMMVLCGRKSYREVTMSSAKLSEEQVLEMISFLHRWLEEKE